MSLKFWNGNSWHEFVSLLPFARLFKDLIILQDDDVPNWTLEENGRFSLKFAHNFLAKPGNSCNWGKLIWCPYIPHARSLVL